MESLTARILLTTCIQLFSEVWLQGAPHVHNIRMADEVSHLLTPATLSWQGKTVTCSLSQEKDSYSVPALNQVYFLSEKKKKIKGSLSKEVGPPLISFAQQEVETQRILSNQ